MPKSPEVATVESLDSHIKNKGLKKRDSLRVVQQKLNDLGHDSGIVDGLIGPNTRKGLESFMTSYSNISTKSRGLIQVELGKTKIEIPEATKAENGEDSEDESTVSENRATNTYSLRTLLSSEWRSPSEYIGFELYITQAHKPFGGKDNEEALENERIAYEKNPKGTENVLRKYYTKDELERYRTQYAQDKQESAELGATYAKVYKRYLEVHKLEDSVKNQTSFSNRYNEDETFRKKYQVVV